MKKILLFVAALCIMVSAQAQTGIRNLSDSPLISSLKKVEMLNRLEKNYTQQLDSMVSADMMTTYIFQYDEHFNLINLLGTGLFSMNEEFSYDDQGHITCVTLSYFGMMYSKTEYTYNDQGWVTEELVYDYNGGEWVYDYKTTYLYDDYGFLMLVQTFEYQQYSEFWKYNEKVEYSYAYGYLTLAIQYQWNNNLEEWEYENKTEYNYNGFGYCSEQYDYSYYEDTWIHERWTTYTYDNLLNCEYQLEYVYDYDSQTQEFGWYVDRQIQFFYDLNVPSSTVAGLHFLEEQFTGLDFVNGGITNINNKLLKVEESTFDGSEIDRTFVTDFYYSGITAINEAYDSQLLLWPNPTTETLNVSAENLQQMDIFDLTGRHITTIENGFETINVSALPTGCYILKATFTDGSKAAHRFVKK